LELSVDQLLVFEVDLCGVQRKYCFFISTEKSLHWNC